MSNQPQTTISLFTQNHPMTKHKTIDGKYTNYLGETWHAYGTEKEVIIWDQKKPHFKAVKGVKMGIFTHRGYVYYLSDFK